MKIDPEKMPRMETAAKITRDNFFTFRVERDPTPEQKKNIIETEQEINEMVKEKLRCFVNDVFYTIGEVSERADKTRRYAVAMTKPAFDLLTRTSAAIDSDVVPHKLCGLPVREMGGDQIVCVIGEEVKLR